MTSNKPDFIYTTYIKSTPEKIWQAITNPEFAKQYWGHGNISDWKQGSEWKHVHGETGDTLVVGKVVESDPPRRLVVTWADPSDLADESRVTFEIVQMTEVVRLNVVHGNFKAGSTMAEKISQGWPLVLSGLKSFLESGKKFDIFAIKGGSCGTPKAA